MCPGITDNAARGQNSSILPGEGSEAARRGGRRPRATMNRIRRPTRCGRRCQEMTAYKMYQLPPSLLAHPRRQANKHINCQPVPVWAWRGPGGRQPRWEGAGRASSEDAGGLSCPHEPSATGGTVSWYRRWHLDPGNV